MTAWYLSRHPQEASDFKDHWRIQQHRNALTLRKLYGEDFLDDANMALLKQRADAVAPRFQWVTRTGKKRVRAAWTPKPLHALAHEVPELLGYHELAYTDTLAHVHANYGGIEQRFEISEWGISFGDETSPGTDDAVLTAAHAILLQVLRLQVEHFKLDALEPALAACVQDFVAVWEKGRPSRA